MQHSEIKRYLDIASRRKWWAILSFLAVLLGGLAAVLVIPKVYKAETLVMVQRQKVPEHYIQEIVSTDLGDRLDMISQQVTSRSNLEKIIAEYGLYAGSQGMALENKIQKLRDRIAIEIARGGRGSTANSFAIAFRDESPQKAMEVTNALASNFITENLKIREEQAIGTSNFLTEELESVQSRLRDKETLLMKYREEHIGGMPENLESNLRMLDRYQEELEGLHENLRDAENRKLIIQEQLAVAEKSEQQLATQQRQEDSIILQPTQQGGAEPEANSLPALRRNLKMLESRYTPQHPDVRKLKTLIAELEKAETESPPVGAAADRPVQVRETGSSRASDLLKTQLAEIEMSISGYKAEILKARDRRTHYQRLVEQTPQREQEIIALRRDYDNLRSLYDSLLDRKLEAEISVNLEKKQKGEQFRVIDVAKVPRIPVEPDVRKILLMTLVLGLGLGGGLAYGREMIDASYKDPAEAEKALQIPVLVSLPLRQTPEDLRRIKRRKVFAVIGVTVGFIAAALAIILATKGIHNTLAFAKDILAGIGS